MFPSKQRCELVDTTFRDGGRFLKPLRVDFTISDIHYFFYQNQNIYNQSSTDLYEYPLSVSVSIPHIYIYIYPLRLTPFCIAGVHRLTTRVNALTVTQVLVIRNANSLIISMIGIKHVGRTI